MRVNKLFVKESKCIFGTPQVEYLGHIITCIGVQANEKKVQAVSSWATP